MISKKTIFLSIQTSLCLAILACGTKHVDNQTTLGACSQGPLNHKAAVGGARTGSGSGSNKVTSSSAPSASASGGSSAVSSAPSASASGGSSTVSSTPSASVGGGGNSAGKAELNNVSNFFPGPLDLSNNQDDNQLYSLKNEAQTLLEEWYNVQLSDASPDVGVYVDEAKLKEANLNNLEELKAMLRKTQLKSYQRNLRLFIPDCEDKNNLYKKTPEALCKEFLVKKIANKVEDEIERYKKEKQKEAIKPGPPKRKKK